MATPNLKKFRPLGNRLLVNVHKVEDDSPLIMPIGYVSNPKELVKATIVSRGSQVSKQFQNRGVVLIMQSVGTEQEVNGFMFRVIRETDIQGVL